VTPERATAALTVSADPHDHDDLVAETPEGPFRRHDAERDRRPEGQDGDQVIAQPAPDEEAHHAADDGEREALLECHGLIT
jgi:hypothetical protein